LAIYHLHVKNISRGDGRSVVAAAAYRAGETLPNEREERLSAFGGRRDVVANEIRLPAQAPAWMQDRARLWNAVEAAEKRKDARLAKELEFALPRELPPGAWLNVARTMADAYTSQGFVVDLAVHDDGLQHNPHAHLLLTTRTVTADGFGPKVRSADGVQFVTEARALWAKVANEALKAAGVSASIDSRSYAEQKIDLTPEQHRGPNAEERRARRALAYAETKPMKDDDDRYPVPDPDGRPIPARELEAAEVRMLDTMHEPVRDPAPLDGDLAAARAAIDGQNARHVDDDGAMAYRLAPENQLDWLDGPRMETVADVEVLDRWENHLDWLNLDRPAPGQGSEDEDRLREPERGAR
jgi:nitrogen fixation protein FixH